MMAVHRHYLQALSTDPLALEFLKKQGTGLVFIDGDHSLQGTFNDHLNVRDQAQWIVHHDIHSEAFPDTTFLWQALEKLEKPIFESIAYIDQYPSVKGSF